MARLVHSVLATAALLTKNDHVRAQGAATRLGIIPALEEGQAEVSVSHPGDPPFTLTTSPAVPDLFRESLRNTGREIDESVSDRLPAEEAVIALETEAGWDPDTASFRCEQLCWCGRGCRYACKCE